MQALTLSCNKIREWPGAVLSTLPNLSCLKLDNNPLVQVYLVVINIANNVDGTFFLYLILLMLFH